MKRIHIIIKGFVQGVGFRQFIKRQANKLALVGYVRNLPDNSVEAEFLGEQKKIDAIVKSCHKGPFLSEVKEVLIHPLEAAKGEQYITFDIRHDF